MKILILENDKNDLRHLLELVKNYFAKKQIAIDIDVYPSISLVEKRDIYDLIFLDIELDDGNIINDIKSIRKMNNHSKIIITSSFKKYLVDGYRINAIRFFIKPIDANEFAIEMNDVVDMIMNSHKVLRIKYNTQELVIDSSDIVFIEYYNRKTLVHLQHGKKVYINSALKEVYEMLPKNSFAYCHKSFIVNLQEIKSIDSYNIEVNGGETIPLSRHFKTELNKHYIEYLGNKEL